MDFEVVTRLRYKTSDGYTGAIVEVKSKLANERFLTSGIRHAMDSSKSMCESNYYFEYIEPKEAELDV